MNNKEKLENWLKNIEQYERLNFNEVKALLKKMKSSSDIQEKQEIREKIILGTLHVIIKFIDRNHLADFDIDIDDVINSSLEVWINAIDSFELLELKGFHEFFDTNFYNKLLEKMIGESFAKEAEENSLDFWFIFSKYVDLTRDYKDTDYASFFEMMHKEYNLFVSVETYELCVKLSETVSKKHIFLRKMNKFKGIFANENLRSQTIDPFWLNEDLEELAFQDELEEILEKIVLDLLNPHSRVLTEEQKKLFKLWFGFDGKGIKSLKEVALILGYSNYGTSVSARKILFQIYKQFYKITSDYTLLPLYSAKYCYEKVKEFVSFYNKMEINIDSLYNEKDWYQMFKLVTSFVKKYDSLLIPEGFRTKNGYDFDKYGIDISRWIDVQCRLYQHKILPDEQVELLKGIGVDLENFKRTSWMRKYNLAKKYFENHGHLNVGDIIYKTIDGVNESYGIGFKLGAWLERQRLADHVCDLSPERVALLKKIGMIWLEPDEYNCTCQTRIVRTCNEHNIDFRLNKEMLLYISYQEFLAKIKFLQSCGLALTDEKGLLHEIFTMNSSDMKEKYGYTLEEMIINYSGIALTKSKGRKKV